MPHTDTMAADPSRHSKVSVTLTFAGLPKLHPTPSQNQRDSTPRLRKAARLARLGRGASAKSRNRAGGRNDLPGDRTAPTSSDSVARCVPRAPSCRATCINTFTLRIAGELASSDMIPPSCSRPTPRATCSSATGCAGTAKSLFDGQVIEHRVIQPGRVIPANAPGGCRLQAGIRVSCCASRPTRFDASCRCP